MAERRLERRLAAVLAADMVGYSRLMGVDEEETIVRQKASHSDLIGPSIAEHHGRIVKTTGDGLLAEFASVVDAVKCAVAIQQGMADQEADLPEEKRIRYRIGVNLGDIVIDGDDILGDGVNLASRLEALAKPGGVSLSAAAYDQIRGRLQLDFEALGEQRLKNIDRPVQVWNWSPDSGTKTARTEAPTGLPALGGQPSVAVLPFDSMSADPDHRFIADGFVEDLTTALSHIDTLRVASRMDAFEHKEKGLSAAGAGRALGVRYVIEGSVRVSGQRIRINAQLIDTVDGRHLWAEKFDGFLDDVFDFQDAISEKIVVALEVQLSDGEQVRIWRREAGNPKAYEHFIRGRAYYKEYSRAGNTRAKAEYESALELSPEFVSAMAGLARTHIEDATFRWSESRKASLEEARNLLDRGLSLDANHAWARAELAHLHMVEGDLDAARSEGALAVQCNPNSADAHNVMAFVLEARGEHEDSLWSARMALKLNPGAPEFYLIPVAEAYIGLGRHQDAIAVLDRILERRPDWLMARALATIAYRGLKDDEAAARAVKKMLEISPRFTVEKWARTIFYPGRDDVDDFRNALSAAGLPKRSPGA